jgi:DNA-binding NtrC family response regulator
MAPAIPDNAPVITFSCDEWPAAGSLATMNPSHAIASPLRSLLEPPPEQRPTRLALVPVAPCSERSSAASEAMRSILETATRLARSHLPLLILGETGVGKEVLARGIHAAGPRRDRPFVVVNCGAIPRELVESTFFGHERGAFTGAIEQRKGIFEAAHGGTVLLDEVGELPPGAQAVLLRVLETGIVARVGSSTEIAVDVRVVSATHRDLETMCDSGAFRRDLLYRLDGATLRIPPLRERASEILPLARQFLREAAGATPPLVDRDAVELLERYAWPGNVRELRNAILRAVALSAGDAISVRDLPERIREAPRTPPAALPADARSETAPFNGAMETLRERMHRLEAQVLLDALRDASWRQTDAARQLGLPLRTLQYKIKMHGFKRLGYEAR